MGEAGRARRADARLTSEVALVISGKSLPPGEYSLFIDLKEHNWLALTWGDTLASVPFKVGG